MMRKNKMTRKDEEKKTSLPYLSLFIKQILSLLIFSFFETIFLSKSTEISLSTLTVKVPPVKSLKFRVIFLFESSIFIFFFTSIRAEEN